MVSDIVITLAATVATTRAVPLLVFLLALLL